MRCLDNSTRIKPFLSSLTKRVFSATCFSSARTTVKRSSELRRIPISIGFSTLLVAMSLLPSLPHTFTLGNSVAAFDESISTFAGDCVTTKTSWDLVGTVCAQVTGAPADRRIAWVAPDGSVAQVTDFFAGTATDSYVLKTGADPLAQLGTWTVQTIDPSGTTFAEARFVVRDPANANADLSLANFGAAQTSAGNNISYRIELTNKGPDEASNVVVTSSVPANTTFVSETQDSGPTFTCTTPSAGSGSGTISCSIAGLPADSTAVFTLVFNVSAGAPNGSVIANTASVTSPTIDVHTADNSASASTTVVAATSSCTITCPSVAPVSTSQCSAVVTYAAPTTAGSCGGNPEEGGSGVACSPPSGSVFPIGNTAVSCTTPTGDSCSFTVTVESSGSDPLAINCPSDVTVSSDSVSAGTATVNYPAPTATGNCATVACVPPSGSSFSVGTTAVTCTATDSSGSTSCTFNVTVNNANPGVCSLTCPGDLTQSAASGCTAVVVYSAPATSGTCGTVTCTPPSGSIFPSGSTTVTCTGADSAVCDFTVTVVAAAAPSIATCATNKTVEVVANCEAAIPDLRSEVVAVGCNVVVSQSPAAGTIVGAGIYTVTLTAENSAGEATCTATVTVHAISQNFTGFFQPVTNLPALNVVNAGRAIPVKFSLNGNHGLDIFAPGFPASGVITCDSGAPPVEVTETVTAGNSSLSYDASSDRYIYVWATQSSWAGTCRQLIIKFKDGCVQVVNFSFR